ncbi:MAG: N-acetylmuramic acid 6-phosphate etherase [Ignavibacteriae bacterium HGW-Ignavibacteriae-1]|jgi:N-acetylmuramic acid 6-phosphate etherase|nr:MAG: N-acetylmuramic acid 6-phosphate etherase [Ignavibacteriae bacterium HGW-Ignavibacteriae-1]
MHPSDLFNEISSLRTEQINPRSVTIDEMTTAEILALINDEDKTVAAAVQLELEHIEKAIEMIVDAFRNGGHLIYVGAGTSGRLGVVDASECPPTFGAAPEMVRGIIAGGKEAVFRSQEGAEDSEESGKQALIEANISNNDIVCGIAASGRTPFVIGALKYAESIQAATIYISTSSKESITKYGVTPDVIIAPNVGPEVIAGSTRMKSGTAQKLILNMLTTTAFIKIGKTYGNVMVDLQLTNQKLRERAKRILIDIAGIEYSAAEILLDNAKGHVKTALLMKLSDSDYDTAQKFLNFADGKIKIALKMIKDKDLNL